MTNFLSICLWSLLFNFSLNKATKLRSNPAGVYVVGSIISSKGRKWLKYPNVEEYVLISYQNKHDKEVHVMDFVRKLVWDF